MNIRDLFANTPAADNVAQNVSAPVVNYGAEAVMRSLFTDKDKAQTSEPKSKTSTTAGKENCAVCRKLYIYGPRYGKHICAARLGRRCALTETTRPCINGCTWACNACAKAANEGQLKTKAKRDEYLTTRGIIAGGEELAQALSAANTFVTEDQSVKAAGKAETGSQRHKRTEGRRRETVRQAKALAAEGDTFGALALIESIPQEDRPFSTLEERADDMMREIFQTMPLSWILTKAEEYAQGQNASLRDATIRRAK